MSLHDFLNAATFEGTIMVKAWDNEQEEEILFKPLGDLLTRDIYVYSWPVTYVYPIETYVNNTRTPCVVIEVSR